jgi:glutamine amidotransferase
MIRVVDYGVGNIQAFLNLFDRLGLKAERASEARDLIDATHLILPGVGHFDYAMRSFNKSGLRAPLEKLVLTQNKPLLGVCVGMQMLAHSSDEGLLPGLGWIPGSVHSFDGKSESESLPLPHMGWNDLKINTPSIVFPTTDIESPQFYFLHSYYFSATNRSDVIATTNYGLDFDAVVRHKNVFGMQCHPEKSHRWGEQFLRAFTEL